MTFDNAIDLATGNYLSATYMADSGSPQMAAFDSAEDYSTKINDAFVFPNQAAPGTVWVYHDNDAFIVNQAMNSYLQQQQGSGADIFNMTRNDVYTPIHISAGFDTLRTDNSATGKSLGDTGLFVTQDDMAKIGKLLNNDGGKIAGSQILSAFKKLFTGARRSSACPKSAQAPIQPTTSTASMLAILPLQRIRNTHATSG